MAQRLQIYLNKHKHKYFLKEILFQDNFCIQKMTIIYSSETSKKQMLSTVLKKFIMTLTFCLELSINDTVPSLPQNMWCWTVTASESMILYWPCLRIYDTGLPMPQNIWYWTVHVTESMILDCPCHRIYDTGLSMPQNLWCWTVTA